MINILRNANENFRKLYSKGILLIALNNFTILHLAKQIVGIDIPVSS